MLGVHRVTMLQFLSCLLCCAKLAHGRIGEPASNAFESTNTFRRVELGSRPEYLVNAMKASPLKAELEACLADETLQIVPDDHVVGHRGAAMFFAEESEESFRAAATQGAGIIECDVAVTEDGELVCRHSQCDLHTSTNILVTDLASECYQPFTPYNETSGEAASAICCTTDITLAEYRTLCSKMDSSYAQAKTAQEFLGGLPTWGTELYSHCAKVMTHNESIELIRSRGRKFVPELKTFWPGDLPIKYDDIRRAMIQAYIDRGIDPAVVWPQSFNMPDILFWIENFPEFAKQAVYLDRTGGEPYCDGTRASCKMIDANFSTWKANGVPILAPPMFVLLKSEDGKYAPSEYAVAAKEAGFKLITWTIDRSGPLYDGGGWYFQTTTDITDTDGDVYDLIDVLFQDVGLESVFSDWPATVTFYANCKLNPLRAATTTTPENRAPAHGKLSCLHVFIAMLGAWVVAI